MDRKEREVDCTREAYQKEKKERKKEKLELMACQLGALLSLPFVPALPSRARRRSWPLLRNSRFPLCRAVASPSPPRNKVRVLCNAALL